MPLKKNIQKNRLPNLSITFMWLCLHVGFFSRLTFIIIRIGSIETLSTSWHLQTRRLVGPSPPPAATPGIRRQFVRSRYPCRLWSLVWWLWCEVATGWGQAVGGPPGEACPLDPCGEGLLQLHWEAAGKEMGRFKLSG